jgi:hypothetical protein
MTYEQVAQELKRIGAEAGLKVYQVDPSTGLGATALYVIPTAWFIATSWSGNGQLNIGIYEGGDLRLVGTRQIAFDQLTETQLRELVEFAILVRRLERKAEPRM